MLSPQKQGKSGDYCTKNIRKAPISRNHALELFIDNVTNDVKNFKQKFNHKAPDNLMPECRKALKELKFLYENENIIIRPFDKGVGFCLMTLEDYINRTMVHLSDATKYKIIEDPTEFAKSLILKITSWTEDFLEENGMTDQIVDLVIPNLEDHKPGNLYLNIKVHKPFPHAGRLITTGCGSYIENVSALTAFELKKVEVPFVIIDLNNIFYVKLIKSIVQVYLRGKQSYTPVLMWSICFLTFHVSSE